MQKPSKLSCGCTVRIAAARSAPAHNSRQLSKEPTDRGREANDERCILEGGYHTLLKGLSPYPRHSIGAPIWNLRDIYAVSCIGLNETATPRLHLFATGREREIALNVSMLPNELSWWDKVWWIVMMGQSTLTHRKHISCTTVHPHTTSCMPR